MQSCCKKCTKRANWKYSQSENGKCVHQDAGKRYYKTLNGFMRQIYKGIERRCSGNSKNPKDKIYLEKGIKNKFKSVNEFISYILNVLKIDPRGLQIHRKDGNGHYEPGNIVFMVAKKHRQLLNAERRWN